MKYGFIALEHHLLWVISHRSVHSSSIVARFTLLFLAFNLLLCFFFFKYLNRRRRGRSLWRRRRLFQVAFAALQNPSEFGAQRKRQENV